MSVKPLSQILKDLPEKNFLTTDEVCKAFDMHKVSLHRWVKKKGIGRYRTNATGRVNLYKREEIVEFAKGLFSLRPVKKGPQSPKASKKSRSKEDDPESPKKAKARSAPRRAKPRRAKKRG